MPNRPNLEITRVRHPLKFRLLQVKRVHAVTPHLVRITLTGDDLHEHNGATEPIPQSRQLFETGATAPGGPTDRTPGYTDRVQQALAKAHASDANTREVA